MKKILQNENKSKINLNKFMVNFDFKIFLNIVSHIKLTINFNSFSYANLQLQKKIKKTSLF